MIRELLKIIKEADDMADRQNQLLSDFQTELANIYFDLKHINETLNQVNS
jgi:hypothetical protein